MSRIMGILISLMYIGGGLVTGYYAHAFRVQHVVEGQLAGVNPEVVAQFLQTNNIFLGPLVLVLAVLVHLWQVKNARMHLENEKALGCKTDELEAALREREKVVDFCHAAIKDAAVEVTTRGEKVPSLPEKE